MLPEQYRQYIDVFDPDKADELPPHRPEVDHQIPLKIDEKDKEKEVPWGALYNMSRDELLVLRKSLTELLDKNFIRLSKSPAGAPVLFAKKTRRRPSILCRLPRPERNYDEGSLPTSINKRNLISHKQGKMAHQA